MKQKIPAKKDFPGEEIKEARGLALLCVNCETYIEEIDVDSHSSVCYKISNVVIEKQNSPWLNASQFKLGRLKEYIEVLRGQISAPGEQSYLMIMARVCGKVAELTTPNDIDELEKYQTSIENIMSREKGSTSLQLTVERLKALLVEHKAALKDKENAEVAIKDLKAEVTFYRQRLKKLEETYKSSQPFVVEAIDSDVSSVESAGITAHFSFTESVDSSPTRVFAETLPQNQLPPEEVRKRQFYATCLAIKLNYPQSHPAYKVPVKKLFMVSQEQNVMPEDWKPFILDYFEKLQYTVPISGNKQLITKLYKTKIEADDINAF